MKRRKITDRDKVAVLERQANCGCGCGLALIAGAAIEYHHQHELALGGPDTADNLIAVRKECHARITNGTKATTAGSSKHKIAKADRLEKARLALAGVTQPQPDPAIVAAYETVVKRQAEQMKLPRGKARIVTFNHKKDRIETRTISDEAMLIPKRRGYSMISKRTKGGKRP